ncbi:STAS domain-containing protein [Nonomuraea sp. NPDC002799]
MSLECRWLAGGVLITVSGEVDHTNADRLESYAGRVRQPGRPLLLDLGRLTFMDSKGLYVLLRLNAATREQGGGLHLVAVHDVPAHLLAITGVWDALTTHDSLAQALATLAGTPSTPAPGKIT